MRKIGWQNGTLISKAKVTINGTIYEVEPEEYDGQTALSAENLIQMENNAENAINGIDTNLRTLIQGTVLYENSEGTKENVTLNDSASDYSYIEIFYSIPDGMMKSVKVYNPNDKSVILDGVWFGDDLYFYTKRIKIEDSMINKRIARTYRILNSTTWTPYGSDADNITIYKVVGYK